MLWIQMGELPGTDDEGAVETASPVEPEDL